MRNLLSFMREEDGMGTVEIVLIIVILIALVAAFKSSIETLVDNILSKIEESAGEIYDKSN